MSVHDLILLEEAHHIRSVDELVRDLEQVGDTRDTLIRWLGHPLWDMTAEEERALRAYLPRAQEAIRERKPTPLLPPVPAKRKD